jgi:hypothetical protein
MPQNFKASVCIEWKKAQPRRPSCHPKSQGFYVPEDVVHLIFKEIMSQGDRASFRTAALLSSTFLYVAQLHLYRSFKLTIGDPTSTRDITTLLDIIDRRPYIGTFIKDFSITDLPHPEKKTLPHGHAVGRENDYISLQAHDYQHVIITKISSRYSH